MDKSAQDMMENIRRLGSSAKDYMGQGADSIQDWYQGVNPDVKKTIMRGLAGAVAGGGSVAALRALTPRDPEISVGKHILSPALLAALLGGGAAAGLPAGLKMLGGGIKFEGEKPRTGGAKALDSIIGPMVRNPATTAGAAIGTAKAPAAAKAFKNLHKTGLLPGKMKVTPKAGLLTIPAGVALGMILDRYLKGQM